MRLFYRRTQKVKNFKVFAQELFFLQDYMLKKDDQIHR